MATRLNLEQGLLGWLWARRDSARTAFLFRVITMFLGMLLSLWWVRFFTRTLGAELYGLFLAFLAVTRLATLGEAGLGSAVALYSIPLVSQQRQDELIGFASAARTLFWFLSIGFGALFVILSPWLPLWLHFKPLPVAGSLVVLFILGACGMAVGIFSSYLTNLGYALGNVSWPVLPLFLLLQIGYLGQAWIAKEGGPLWAQYTPHLLATLSGMWITWFGIKLANRPVSRLGSLRIDGATFKKLLTSGFWIYLSAVGHLIFTSTDQLLVNAGFGAEVVARYTVNYKVPELAYGIVAAAGLVAFSKIARLVNSSSESQQAQGHALFNYLHRLQIWSMMCVSSLYLFFNQWFIGRWLGSDYQVSVNLQLAFAANLVFAAAGDAAIRGVSMFSQLNLAYFGAVIFAMGALNLLLSLLAVKSAFLVGIAVATVISQVGLNYLLSLRLCRSQGWASREFLELSLFQPLIFVVCLSMLNLLFRNDPVLWQQFALIIAVFGLLGYEFFALGLRPRQLASEYKHLRDLFRPKPANNLAVS